MEAGEHEPSIGVDWVTLDTTEPAADAISFFVLEDDWRKSPYNSEETRSDTMSWVIKQRQTPSGQAQVIDSWSAKTGGANAADALTSALEQILEFIPEPARLILVISRSPLPELRSPDSTRTFYLINSAWIQARSQNAETGAMAQPNTGAPAPVRGLFAGPSPIGVQIKPTAPTASPPGITGDIGGTGIGVMVTSFSDAMVQLLDACKNTLMFAADLNARSMAFMASQLQKHPDALAEGARLDHEYRMKQLEASKESDLEKVREVGGVAKELGGKLLENPAIAAPLLAWSRKNGVSMDDVKAILRGDG